MKLDTLTFLAGDIPPPPADKADPKAASVPCELCHIMVEFFKGELPVNGNFIVKPGNVKYGSREGIDSPYHRSQYLAFQKKPQLCETCHDETSPFGTWVKETYREWKQSLYGKANIVCMDCHGPSAWNTEVFDNRLRQLETHLETYQWNVPSDVAKGNLKIIADLNYRRLLQSVADLVGIGKIPVLNVAKDRVIVKIK